LWKQWKPLLSKQKLIIRREKINFMRKKLRKRATERDFTERSLHKGLWNATMLDGTPVKVGGDKVTYDEEDYPILIRGYVRVSRSRAIVTDTFESTRYGNFREKVKTMKYYQISTHDCGEITSGST
tara:strand:- start:71 stop:448 length:378 start_codon:yes stop_codon:yes gene_type:complete